MVVTTTTRLLGRLLLLLLLGLLRLLLLLLCLLCFLCFLLGLLSLLLGISLGVGLLLVLGEELSIELGLFLSQGQLTNDGLRGKRSKKVPVIKNDSTFIDACAHDRAEGVNLLRGHFYLELWLVDQGDEPAVDMREWSTESWIEDLKIVAGRELCNKGGETGEVWTSSQNAASPLV